MMQSTQSVPSRRRTWFQTRFPEPENPDNAYTRAVLDHHKAEGLELAVRARWIALAVIAVMLPFMNPRPEVLYYEVLLLCVAAVGWVQRRVGKVGQSRVELAVLFCDLALMTVILAFHNPFSAQEMGNALTFRFGNFIYFFVTLAAGTLAFSWRTVIAIGTWTAVLWSVAVAYQWWTTQPDAALAKAISDLPGVTPRILEVIDPNSFQLDVRLQEVVVFMLVAAILGFSMRRFTTLLLGNAALERERANLSRYFSPNVVEELSQNDEPLRQIRSQDVAVMFVDIVGFTEYASNRPPDAVIATLRDFHALMEAEIFANAGTLDKFLGDGLMATFGTPVAGKQDATNAILCARAMMHSLDHWNETRRSAGEPTIEARFGLHYGVVVLGDIGVNRLEFAVIGNTVNVASRLEALTRPLAVRLAASHAFVQRVKDEGNASDTCLAGLENRGAHPIRGVPRDMTVWSFS